MKNLFLTTLICTLLISCAKEQPITKAKINLIQSAEADLFPAGVFIAGKHLDSGAVFSKRISGNSHDMELPSGNWKFKAHAWGGSLNMGGALYCFSSSTINLDQLDVDIDVNLAKENCGDSFFSKQGYSKQVTIENKNFLYPKPLQVVSCEVDNEAEVAAKITSRNVDVNSVCNNGAGLHRSFRVTYFDYPLSAPNKLVDNKTNPFRSKCIDLDNLNHNTSASTITVPALDTFPVNIRVYYSTGCDESKPTSVLKFDNGLFNGNAKDINGLVKEGHPSYTKVFALSRACDSTYAQHSLMANYSNSSLTGLDGSSKEKALYVCNANQFNDIGATAALSGLHYEIKKDIVFPVGQSSNVKTNTFSGSIDGNGHIISNLTIDEAQGDFGLFKQINSNNNYIKDLKFKNISLNNTSATGNYNGVLAGKLSLNGSSTIEIENVSIENDNPLVAGLTALEGSMGGFFGTIYASSVSEHSRIQNLKSNITIKSLCTSSCENIGGFAGYLQNFTGSEGQFENIKVNSKIETQANNVGGIFGKADKAKLFDVEFLGELKANNSVGGIIGFGSDVKIHKAFANFNYTIASPADSMDVGGLVGLLKYESNTNVDIAHSLTDITVANSTNFRVSNLGGLVGQLTHGSTPTGSSAAIIQKNKAHISTISNGDRQGGLAGHVHMSQNNGSITFRENYSTGQLKRKDTSGGNFLGGFVGKTSVSIAAKHKIAFEKSISQVDLLGKTFIGGITGYNENARFKDLVYEGDVTAQVSNIAGVTPHNEAHGRFENISIKGKLKINTAFDTKGKITVINDPNGVTYSERSFELIEINELESYDESNTLVNFPDFKGSCAECTLITWDADPNSDANIDITKVSNAATIHGNFSPGSASQWNKIVSKMYQVFERQIFTLSNSSAPTPGNKHKYHIGNWLDPFPISNRTQWNVIAADPTKMNYAFKLMDNIDFLNNPSQFTMIGNDSNAFKGILIPNGKTLSNIHLRPSMAGVSSGAGIFGNIGDDNGAGAIIGTFEDPLKVNNIHVDGTGTSSFDNIGTIAGAVHNGLIFAQVKNAKIDNFGSTTSKVGGLVGAMSKGKIYNSSFSGTIDTDQTNAVGGILGFQSRSTLGLNETDVEIRHVTVETSKIKGKAKVGGFIGRVENTGSDAKLRVEYNKLIIHRDPSTSNLGMVTASDGALEAAYITPISAFSSSYGEFKRNVAILTNAYVADTRGKFFKNSAASALGEKNYIIHANLSNSDKSGANEIHSSETAIPDYRPEEMGSF